MLKVVKNDSLGLLV